MSAGRILVVDDEPQIRRVMRTTLVANGYEMAEARNGDDALEMVRNDRYDLILLDMNMPGRSGLDTCRAIRELRPGLDLAIIVLTVRGAEKDKVEALDAGADDYITKPYSTPELLARIRAALRRTPLTPDNAPSDYPVASATPNGLWLWSLAPRICSYSVDFRLAPSPRRV